MIRVREITRERLYAQRRPPQGTDIESADDILTRLLDELEGLREAEKGRASGRAAKAST